MDGGGQGDAGTVDAGGGGACPTGQHRCGAGCIDDLENLPENGCRLGCGEPCPAPAGGAAACDDAGMCTLGCEPPFHMQDGECVCAPRTCDDIGYQCGAPDDGCGTPLDCGACDGDGVCMDGLCSCPKDEREPNDSLLAVRDTQVEHIPDENDWERTYASWNLHSATDADWYRFKVTEDGWNNPGITLTLSGVPDGSEYELMAYYVCDDGADISDCTVGSPCTRRATRMNNALLQFDIDCDRVGWDDSGALFIRVTSVRWGGSCAPYSLTVKSES